MAASTPEKEPQPEPTPTPTPSPTLKPETKKQEKKAESRPIYPKYPGYSCPVCGSKRVTNSEGNYICPVVPNPSDCPVK